MRAFVYILTVAVVPVYLASIRQRPHLQGHVPLILGNGQRTREGVLGSIVVTSLLTQE